MKCPIVIIASALLGCQNPLTQVSTPFFSPSSGTFNSDQLVTINCVTAGALIYYTTDGSTPTTSSTQNTAPISVAGDGTSTTIKAIATLSGMTTSAEASAGFTIVYSQVSNLQFSPTTGTYSSDQLVTISCITPGDIIHYTTDGSTPTTSSPEYSAPIPVAGNGTTMTVKAIAAAPRMAASAVGSAAYAINYSQVSTPQFSPSSGIYGDGQLVTISCATGGAEIFYTIDGSSPSTSSAVYGVPIALEINGPAIILKAIATKAGMTPSGIASATYSNSLLQAQWARSTFSGYDSRFRSIAVNFPDQVFAAGDAAFCDFGNDIRPWSILSPSLVLVGYNASGAAQSASSIEASGVATSQYTSLSNNTSYVWAAGYFHAHGPNTFGFSGISFMGTDFDSALITRNNSSCTAQSGANVTGGNSRFNCVTAYGVIRAYAVGYFIGPGPFAFGNGQTVAGAYAGGKNAMLAEYDSSCLALAASSAVTAPNASEFNSVAVDPAGNVYAIGTLYGSGLFDFGNNVTAIGSNGKNAVLVKYNSSCVAQAATSIIGGPNESEFNSVIIDPSGNVYIVGTISGSGTYSFGNGITVKGSYASGINAVLVKYDPALEAQSGASVMSGSNESQFSSVAIDPAGNVYAAGYMYGSGYYQFGNAVTIRGPYASGNNAVLVRYNSSCVAQLARAVTSGTNESRFNSVTVDSSGDVYAAGTIYGTEAYYFGPTVMTARAYATGPNAVLVKYW